MKKGKCGHAEQTEKHLIISKNQWELHKEYGLKGNIQEGKLNKIGFNASYTQIKTPDSVIHWNIGLEILHVPLKNE